ncbi:MAG TPA: kelch repeat-containing protein [Polyangia bacterium]|nr:kelch repeat-containing protein [Polyangia bacterium]
MTALLLAGCTQPRPSPLDAGTGPGSWAGARPLPQERFEAYAVTLHGKIHFIGGISDLGCPDGANACVSDHVDVYDPAQQMWFDGPPLPAEAPRHHLAVALSNDTVYVLGGFTGIIGGTLNFAPVPTTYSFDGATWKRLADQPLARGSATAQAIDGKIYVAGGGKQEPDALNDLYVYDPAADQWTALAPMPTAREHVASCALQGKFLVVGGWLNDKTVVAAAEAYDPALNRWTVLPDLPTPRGGLAANVLGTTCYAIGGEQWIGPDPATFADNQGFDFANGQWRPFAPNPHRRHGMGLAALGGSLYAVGGGPSRGNSYTNVVDVFTP